MIKHEETLRNTKLLNYSWLPHIKANLDQMLHAVSSEEISYLYFSHRVVAAEIKGRGKNIQRTPFKRQTFPI